MAQELGLAMGWPVHSTDDLMGMGWSEASDEICNVWFNFTSPNIIEGTAVIRGLRKWLERNPEGLPFDRMIWLPQAHVTLSPGQHSMAKGCATIFEQIRPEICRRGYLI
jgi:hypothetical protein